MVVKIDAQNVVKAVDNTISSCSYPSSIILYLYFIQKNSNDNIAKRLGYQNTRFHEIKNDALVKFAERFVLISLSNLGMVKTMLPLSRMDIDRRQADMYLYLRLVKKLKVNWVPGQHFLQKATKQTSNQIPQLITPVMNDILRRLME